MSDINQPFPQISAPLTTNYDSEGRVAGFGKINQIWLQLFMAVWVRTGGAGGILTEEAILLAIANEDLHQSKASELALLAGSAGDAAASMSSILGLLVHDSVVRVIESMELGVAQAPITSDPALAELFALPAPGPAALESGYYTPTLTNVANLDASTAYSCQFLRVKDTVTVSGKVDVDPTAPAAATQLGISLPFPSTFTAAEQCAGTAAASGIAGQSAAILADFTNFRAEMNWIAGDVTNQPMYFSFTYRMI